MILCRVRWSRAVVLSILPAWAGTVDDCGAPVDPRVKYFVQFRRFGSSRRRLARRDTGRVHAASPVEDAAPRILMLGKGWFPAEIGGLDRYFRELFEHLPDARAVVVGPAPDAPSSVRAIATHDAPLITRIRGLAEMTRRLAPGVDVVDVHFALYGFWPVVVGALRRKPLVVHFQGPWADENVATGDASFWRHRARRLLEASVYRRADTVVTLTGAFRQVVIERYGVSPWKVRVERPGVDLTRFGLADRASARAALGLDEGTFVAVCVRRLVERMGVEVLLDAWESAPFAANRPRRLLIAGDGPLRPVLAARIAGSPVLARSVELLGRVEEDQLRDLYRAADLNVVPTLAFEGFGLVVLEAAACGTTSLVTDSGGLPEAVVGAPGARVVAAGSVAALGAALVHHVAPPRDALRRWAEAAAWPVVAERHRRLYQDAHRPAVACPLRVVVLDHVAQLSGGEIALLRLLPHLKRSTSTSCSRRTARSSVACTASVSPCRCSRSARHLARCARGRWVFGPSLSARCGPPSSMSCDSPG